MWGYSCFFFLSPPPLPMSAPTLPPPPYPPFRPLQQFPPPLLHAQANPPFVNPNCFPNLHHFFPPYQIPLQQSCYWPSQFGQYIPNHMPVQPSLPPLNLNPPKLPPSPSNTSLPSQIKPLPSHGEQGKSASFRIDTKAFFLAFDGGDFLEAEIKGFVLKRGGQ